MTSGQSGVGPTAGTQWLLVLPFIGLNARFKLAVLWKGREALRLYNANGYSIHIPLPPWGSGRKLGPGAQRSRTKNASILCSDSGDSDLNGAADVK